MLKKFRITGIVQGVGFRPFVYRLAKENNLNGYVYNDSEGVVSLVKGEKESVEEFKKNLISKAPSMAVISEIIEQEINEAEREKEYNSFLIMPSPQGGERQVFISPDIATCQECVEELKNPNDRRYRYPFINCTNCGPRYSIIENIPYDRPNTTMGKFKMCPRCQSEYENPSDRRFHAQPDACSECGPQYFLKDNSGTEIKGNPVEKAKEFLKAGAIVAIKGIGGYHLACNANDENAVNILRKRKHREAKPLAVMTGSLARARELCEINADEEKLLTSSTAPVVLLKKRKEILAPSVAPNNPYLGIMLPYAPVHYLLLDENDVLVMTSGNISQEPIAYKDDEAFSKLKNIADYFLGHNREIAYRVDDSVVRVIDGKQLILRRSRGMAPAPIELKNSRISVLSAGAELKNTFCLNKNNVAFISEHIGDLANLPIYDSYKKILAHYEDIFSIHPKAIACDLHPSYFASSYARQLAKERDIPLIEVQHHHAHITSVMAEKHIDEKVIGVAFDGTGYGTDGAVWGGEFLAADLENFSRKAHFTYLPLPGGDKAAKEPWRQAVFVLDKIFGRDAKDKIEKIPNADKNWKLLLQAAKAGINAPLTSSAGRIFDTASAILGICGRNSYEGQAAVMLELMACSVEADYRGNVLSYEIKDNEEISIINILPLMKFLAEENISATKEKTAELAMDFHVTMADIILKTVNKISGETGIKTIVLSGGVFQNRLLLTKTLELLNDKYKVLIPEKLPINDGGLSLGQTAVALKRLESSLCV